MKEAISIVVCPECNHIILDQDLVYQGTENGICYQCNECGEMMLDGLLVVGIDAKEEALEAIRNQEISRGR